MLSANNTNRKQISSLQSGHLGEEDGVGIWKNSTFLWYGRKPLKEVTCMLYMWIADQKQQIKKKKN